MRSSTSHENAEGFRVGWALRSNSISMGRLKRANLARVGLDCLEAGQGHFAIVCGALPSISPDPFEDARQYDVLSLSHGDTWLDASFSAVGRAVRATRASQSQPEPVAMRKPHSGTYCFQLLGYHCAQNPRDVACAWANSSRTSLYHP